jgi:F0F1-type ATP synthase membrane subunit c/vacuolar-type H+-ATPase subunit K
MARLTAHRPAIANLNRSFAAFELWLIAVPMFFLSVLGWTLIPYSVTIAPLYARWIYIAFMLASPLCCLCCGALIAILASKGPAALAGTRTLLWVGTFIGAAFVVSGGCIGFMTNGWSVQASYAPLAGFTIFTTGAPMLLPALHVSLVRLRQRASNGVERAIHD